jgi:hypothetical protein
MAIPSLGTELDAVNTMLSGIGQYPVSSLSLPTTNDVTVATTILSEISREVQIRGWHWNSEYNYPLAPDEDGHIIVPDDFVRVDFPYWQSPDIALRGRYLYDKGNHTNVFSGTLYVDVVRLLDFNDLPETCKRFITTKATRVFQARVLGSETLTKEALKTETDAWSILLQQELDDGDYNMIGDSTSIRAQRRSLYT